MKKHKKIKELFEWPDNECVLIYDETFETKRGFTHLESVGMVGSF